MISTKFIGLKPGSLSPSTSAVDFESLVITAVIAYQCGFRDAQHMRSVFNRRLGVTPQQFRLNFAAMV